MRRHELTDGEWRLVEPLLPRQARGGIDAVMPQQSDEMEPDGDLGLDRRTERRRSAVERCVGWLKECRRVGTRVDTLASSFMAFVRLAFIQRHRRLLAPSDRT